MIRLTTLTLFLFAIGSSHGTDSVNGNFNDADSSIADFHVEQGAGFMLTKFRHWVIEHGKKYKSEAEELLRLKIWTENHGTFLFLDTSHVR